MSWMRHVERYVALKHRSGYKFFSQERILRSYARHAIAAGDEFTSAGTIIEWAAQTASAHHAREKLALVRGFAVWLHAEDDRHEVPPRDFLGRNQRRRPAPQLLTPSQVGQLMQAALALGPVGSITPHTYRYLFGLIASTGLRRSEAISLKLTDVTEDGLLVRDTKYRKSRLVPLHDSVRDALERYLAIRKRMGGPDDHLFVLSTGRPPSRSAVTKTFIKLARQTGLREDGGGPRLHGLRHGFATRSLEAVVETGRDNINRHILALSTYLGHTNLSNTYWYLEATPVLLRTIADSAERAHTGRTSK